MITLSIVISSVALARISYLKHDNIRFAPFERAEESNSFGKLRGYYGNRIYFWGRNLHPMTQYTLVYSPDEVYEDYYALFIELPRATCIVDSRSYESGYLYMRAAFDYSRLIDDKNGFWLVKSSDVDCDEGNMTAWYPYEYLFGVD